MSIDQVIKIDGCPDEYQPGKASAELSREMLTANVIEHHLEATRDLKKKNTLISNRKPLVLSPVFSDVVTVTRDDHSNHVFHGVFS